MPKSAKPAKPAKSAKPSFRPRVTRRDAFFGLHFDLHPHAEDTVLGRDITDANIDKLLIRVAPDYIQYDCKGHAGYTGYPTKVGWPSPGIVKDSLAIWRKVTARHGVALVIHYSGVWDMVACEHHPEWQARGANGKPVPGITSVFGPYVDELLIPQLREAATAYDLDGAWVDGECWAAVLDYSPAAVKAWRTALCCGPAIKPPKKPSDPLWLEWKMFHRRAFEEYLRHWVDALHESHPDFQITSNWAYTTLMPWSVGVPLDFISGDYSPTLSLDRARVEARYMANVGEPWDLLAWGFNWQGNLGHSIKKAVALQQEAAATLVHGGGFAIYYVPTRAGFVTDDIIDASGQVADFCRARQKLCHRSSTVPQVALLLSVETQMDRSDAVFHWGGCMDEIEGALHALLESHYSVDILSEWQLEAQLTDYPLVVIADSYKLTPDFRTALLEYVKDGGSLLLLGEKCARLFADELGAKLIGEPAEVTAELGSAASGVVNCNGLWQEVSPTKAKTLSHRYPTRDTRKDGQPAATIAKFGQGKIAAFYGPVALNYFRCHHPVLRALIADAAAALFPDPRVKTDAPSCVEIILRHTSTGRLAVHLLNTAETQRADRFLAPDFIPSVGPFTVDVSVAIRPQRVSWRPDGGRLKWSWAAGKLTVTIPRLDIHGAIVVE
jgi:hypothetical protein